MKRANPEAALQAQIWQLIRLKKRPGVLAWAVCNNPRSARDGARLKRMGLVAGVADMHFLAGGRFYSLELKTEKGRATEDQLGWRDNVNDCGGYGAIAYGYEAALSILRMWGVLR